MFETELKFQVPAEAARAVRAALSAAAPRRQRLQAIYFDTDDGALGRAGIALRLRREGPRWVQTLKARGAHAAQRHEHNAPLPRGRVDEASRPLLARHAGTPAAAAWGEALGEPMDAFDATRLQPVMATDIWRRSVVLRGDGFAVELAFDEGEVRAAGRVARVCELEYELLEGTLADLARLAGDGIDRHGLFLDTVSKAERGELLARGAASPAPVRFHAARQAPVPAGAAAWWGDALARCAAMVLPNASALANGSTDPEHVHQLRVGIRRLRTAVRELGPLAGQRAEPAWLPPLVELFRALGAGRDAAALLATLTPQLRAVGAPCTDWRDAADPPPPEPAALVRAAGVQQALLGLLVAAAGPVPGGAEPAKEAGEAARQLRDRLASLRRQVVRAGRVFEQLPEARQHQARKRLKRLRYLAEFAGLALGKRRALARWLKVLSAAQDALGVHQDRLVALPLYRAAAARRPEAWFAVGWLTAELGTSAHACRQALARLEDAKRFW
jgi:inorganic triphosphatase YgiF